ncbi:hypothetical protein [Palaeococcus ferrophilus]|uniref:hypothetical protein n=1 Tax=Palaeococcus ferrophilus TaxID=83868 RepID=UPI00064E1EB7|nr:hypothetical protein [Palaeococcus ferrophilus]
MVPAKVGWAQLTKRKALFAGLFLVLYFVRTPLGMLGLMFVLGIVLASRIFEEPEEGLLISPALGASYIIIASYLLSFLGIPLKYLDILAILSGILMVLFEKHSLKFDFDRKVAFVLATVVLMEFAVKRFYFLLPDYRAPDTWFHASKVRMILDTGSLYFQSVPPYFSSSITTYPSGYHSLVAWLSAGNPGNIIFAMNYLRLFEWAYFPVATYLAAKALLGKDAALYAALITPFSALYYYFVQYALLPAFTNYMFFLFALFLYVRAMDVGDVKYISTATVVSTVMLLVHPYQYMIFQAFAGFYMLSKRKERRAFWVFLVQLLVSAGFYYLSTPRAQAYMQNGIKINSIYANKDNVEFLMNILRFTFFDNGQLLLGFGFGMALLLSIATHNRLLPLTSTLLFIFFLILNKIYWRFPIPYYSAIWNSERTFILLTPIIPIFEGVGVCYIVSFILSRVKGVFTRGSGIVVAVVLLLSLAPAVYPLSIEHMASESSYILDENVVSALKAVSNYVGTTPVATACVFDSGRWLPILMDTPIVCLASNSGLNPERYRSLLEGNLARYLYVDTRGTAEIDPYPLNVEEFYKRYRLVYFNSGLWLFDVSSHDPRENIKFVRDYFGVNDTIDCSKDESERYFVYGWVLRNYATRKARIKGTPYIVTISRNSTIAFVPTGNYTGIKLLLSLPAGKRVRFYVNGEPAGEFLSRKEYTPQWVELNHRLLPGELNFLTIEVELKENEALGVRYIKLITG